LQKITDTFGGGEEEPVERKFDDAPVFTMPAQFSRQISVDELNDMQMKRSGGKAQ
jgi:hypothetical protein